MIKIVELELSRMIQKVWCKWRRCFLCWEPKIMPNKTCLQHYFGSQWWKPSPTISIILHSILSNVYTKLLIYSTKDVQLLDSWPTIEEKKAHGLVFGGMYAKFIQLCINSSRWLCSFFIPYQFVLKNQYIFPLGWF